MIWQSAQEVVRMMSEMDMLELALWEARLLRKVSRVVHTGYSV